MTLAVLADRGVGGGLPFNAGPGEVHIEQEEKNAETNYGWL
jgi:hypothetical protein